MEKGRGGPSRPPDCNRFATQRHGMDRDTVGVSDLGDASATADPAHVLVACGALTAGKLVGEAADILRFKSRDAALLSAESVDDGRDDLVRSVLLDEVLGLG